jgi:phosphatidylglycerophosphate synthase
MFLFKETCYLNFVLLSSVRVASHENPLERRVDIGVADCSNRRMKPEKPDFKAVLKEDARYPILKYMRLERYISRPIEWQIAKLVLLTRVTPNQVTYAAFFIGLCASALFLTGRHAGFVLGAVLALFSAYIDGVDGMLARAKNLRSDFGAYLDLFLDRLTDFFLFGAVVIGWYRWRGDFSQLIIGLVGLGLYHLQVALYYLVEAYKKNDKTGQSGEARGFVFYGILLFSILNRLDILVYILFIEPVGNIIFRTIYFYRQRKFFN